MWYDIYGDSMKQENLKTKAKDFVTEMKIKGFYQLHKGKGITMGYSAMLFYQGLNEVLEDITFSKNLNDFYSKIINNTNSYTKKAIFPSIISGFLFGIFNGNISVYFSEKQNKLLLSHNFNPVSTRRFLEQYKKTIYEYIKNDNALANNILRDNNGLNNNFNTELEQRHIDAIIDQLFIDRSDFSIPQNENIRVVSKIILEMQALYTPNILFNNQAFVEFEMKYGYFRKYSSALNMNQDIPTLQERIDTFEIQKEMSPEEKIQLDNLPLLEQRVSRLAPQYRENLYSILKQAKLETNNRTRIELTDDCYSMYEIAFREEIVDSLYAPQSSVELTNYQELKNVLLHTFLRDSNCLLDGYEEQLKKQIIAARLNGDTSETLTPQEQEIINRRMQYARDVEANPTIVEESLNMFTNYTDSTGLKGYTSDTRNQISASFFSPETLLNMGTCIGIGFDRNGLKAENIAVSSSGYLTSNKGLSNLEVNTEDMFSVLSSPVSELKQARKSELVLFRKNIDSVTKASYVFVILSGFNNQKDEQALQEAKKLSRDNNMKLVVFNLSEIKRSLGIQNTNEQTRRTL